MLDGAGLGRFPVEHGWPGSPDPLPTTRPLTSSMLGPWPSSSMVDKAGPVRRIAVVLRPGGQFVLGGVVIPLDPTP